MSSRIGLWGCHAAKRYIVKHLKHFGYRFFLLLLFGKMTILKLKIQSLPGVMAKK